MKLRHLFAAAILSACALCTFRTAAVSSRAGAARRQPVSPVAKAPQFLDNNGQPIAGGLIYTYASGTNTPLATFPITQRRRRRRTPLCSTPPKRANLVWTLDLRD